MVFGIPWNLFVPTTSCFVLGAGYYVWWYDEAYKRVRHKSIERDIKREAWRRQQLGLPEDDPMEDGFAKKYMNQSSVKGQPGTAEPELGTNVGLRSSAVGSALWPSKQT